MSAITKRRHAELAGQAMKFVAELMLIEPLSPAFDHKLEAIEALGRDTIAAASARHAGSLAHVAPPTTGGIAQATAALRSIAGALEPLREGNLAGAAKRFGLFAAKPDPAAYFRRYAAAESEIAAVLTSLTRERDALLRANVGLEAEEASLRPLVEALAEHALFAEEVAPTLEARAAMIEAKEPMKARRLTADALHTVRTRARDIAEARAVTTQALAARELVSGTNAQLIEAIEQATATMLMVLRTAMEAARMIARHDLVLDRIAGLNRAASNLITDESPPEGDKAEALQSAFARLYDALDRLESERAGIPTLPPR
ncbi:toxic anion resistance protein [Erythrobacter sp. CCH5-A1]|uniref:toxic anion resistance protein n=1 Tax=Erythrobacter sp. CCH5-A1 TaxID=1768792 RepID=UPI0008371654|nr:toxic anion resistance protein [Erythrobacter sp. CCH5-A1]